MFNMALFARAIMPILAFVRTLFTLRAEQPKWLEMEGGKPVVSIIRAFYL